MSERLHCDYWGKYVSEGTPKYELEIMSITAKLDLHDESIPFHRIRLDLCSEECLKKTLNLGEKILEWGHIADGSYLEKCFKEKEAENG